MIPLVSVHAIGGTASSYFSFYHLLALGPVSLYVVKICDIFAHCTRDVSIQYTRRDEFTVKEQSKNENRIEAKTAKHYHSLIHYITLIKNPLVASTML